MVWSEILLTIVIPAVSVAGTIIISLSKSVRVKKYVVDILAVTENTKKFIIEAEKYENYTGQEKKNFVLSRLLMFIVDNSIKHIEIKDLNEIIENEIDITNKVNIKKKSQCLSVEKLEPLNHLLSA